MGYGRFALSSLSMKPEDAGCSRVCVVDPVHDFLQDLFSRAIKTLLLLVLPDSARTSQEVQTEVLPHLLDVALNLLDVVLDSTSA